MAFDTATTGEAKEPTDSAPEVDHRSPKQSAVLASLAAELEAHRRRLLATVAAIAFVLASVSAVIMTVQQMGAAAIVPTGLIALAGLLAWLLALAGRRHAAFGFFSVGIVLMAAVSHITQAYSPLAAIYPVS